MVNIHYLENSARWDIIEKKSVINSIRDPTTFSYPIPPASLNPDSHFPNAAECFTNLWVTQC